MEEVFKKRVAEVSQEPQEAPQAAKEIVSDKLAGNEDKATEELTEEEHTLEIWEGLNRRKYGHDYFNIKNTVHEFPLKAHFGFIDKFVKAEMEAQGMEMNTQNYEKFLSDIEKEIGTTQTETYKRVRKIFDYIQILKKYREIKGKKEAYKTLLKD